MQTTRKMYLPDLKGNPIEHNVRVKYDQQEDRFRATIPGHLSPSDLGRSSRKLPSGAVEVTIPNALVYGRTPGEVFAQIERMAADYRLAVKQQRKVIIYKFSCNDGENRDDFPFHSGLCLGLHWDVAWEVATGDRRVYYRNESAAAAHGTSRVVLGSGYFQADHDSRAMDWTQGREAFFQQAHGALEELIARCLDFFGQGETDLAKLIDSRPEMKLLGGE